MTCMVVGTDLYGGYVDGMSSSEGGCGYVDGMSSS